MVLTTEQRLSKIILITAKEPIEAFGDGVDIVKAEIKARMDAIKEQRKELLELLVDTIAAAIPGGDGIIAVVNDMTKEIGKVVTKKYIISNDEDARLSQLDAYPTVLKEVFARRIGQMHTFFDENLENPDKLPDWVLIKLTKKFDRDNFNPTTIAEQIRKHLTLLDKFVLSYGLLPNTEGQEFYKGYNQRVQRTIEYSIEMRGISNRLPNEVVYMPVFVTRRATTATEIPSDLHNQMGLPPQTLRTSHATDIYYEFIPTSFVDSAIKAATNHNRIHVRPNLLSYKSPNFLNEFYGKNVNIDLIKSKSRHFKHSILRQKVENREVFGIRYTTTVYARLNPVEQLVLDEVDSL